MIDELLGRLEATTIKFDIGRGGIPELTPQDLAAALGMCENKFAATIYHAAAGGTVADWAGLDHALAELQFREWRARADRLVTAQLAVAEAQIADCARRERISRAKLMLDGARAAMWPALVDETYRNMRKALLAELRASRTCPVCQGRGTVMVDAVVEGCKTCMATGLTSVSDRQRAEMLGVDPSTYRRNKWKAAYEWMHRMLVDAVADGREQFAKALDRLAA